MVIYFEVAQVGDDWFTLIVAQTKTRTVKDKPIANFGKRKEDAIANHQRVLCA